jgi:hypothetical protein
MADESCYFGPMVVQYIMLGVCGGRGPFTRWPACKGGRVGAILHDTPSNERPPIKPHFLKVPPSPNNIKLGIKPLI